MKTETLIELQQSITQGEWKHDGAGYGNIRPVKETGRNICTFTRQFSNDEWKQVNADARAIALVPELIAEVIRLREVLRACADQLDAETLGGEALDSARAALANDK